MKKCNNYKMYLKTLLGEKKKNRTEKRKLQWDAQTAHLG